MPYLLLNTSKTLTTEQRETVKAELGKLISILPDKSEEYLMLDFSEGRPMYFRGLPADSYAFIELRLWGKSPPQAKKQFVQQVFRLMDHVLGIKENDLFINVLEFDDWGFAGGLETLN